MTTLIPACVAVGIQAILALSVNLTSGYARRLSLGQAAFAGLGAYASALISVTWQWPFWIACPLSVVVGASIGLLCGLPMLGRVPYFIPILTLAFNVLAQHLIRSGRLVAVGVGGIPPPEWRGVAFSPGAYLMLVIIAMGGCLGIDWWFCRSHWGRHLRAHRASIEAGRAAPGGAGLVAFVLSAGMAGLAGSLFAHFEGFISPFDFDLEASLFVLALAVAGGLGIGWRVLLGAVVLGGLVEGLQVVSDYRLLISGVIFLLAGISWGRRRQS